MSISPIALILVGIKSIVSIVPFMELCFVFVTETVVDKVLFIELRQQQGIFCPH